VLINYKMDDKATCRAMAERGFELTPAELQTDKESIVRKFSALMPELRDMNTEEALDYIVNKIK